MDHEVFGKNHAMKAILGATRVNQFEEISFQLQNARALIKSVALPEAELKCLARLTNEILYTLNKGIMNDGQSNGIFHPRIRSTEERASDPKD